MVCARISIDLASNNLSTGMVVYNWAQIDLNTSTMQLEYCYRKQKLEK